MTSTAAPPGPDDRRRAQGHYAMALGWLKRGRLRPAVAGFSQAIDTDPTLVEAYLMLGQLLMHQRRWHDVVQLCRRGFVRCMEVPELHKMLITALAELGTLDDAFAAYELARKDVRPLEVRPEEILCCVTVRNERVRLPYFLDYYRRLGVDRFLFVDNDSHDGTPEWLLEQPDVHLWTSPLLFTRANFGSAWFELLLRKYGLGHWCLTVDVDEFLLYEGAPERTLPAFCADLDRRDRKVATGILLDLYSDRPIGETVYREGDDPLALCPYFDREYSHTRQDESGSYKNQTISFGGVRQRVFPAEHDYLLSKAVLLRYEPDVVLTSGQHLTNIPGEFHARDEICVLHFKFLHTFLEYARTEAERGAHAMGAEQYKAYQRQLALHGDLVLHDPARSVAFEGTGQLRRLGVLRAEEPVPAPRVPRIGPVPRFHGPRPRWSVALTVYDRVANIEPALQSVLRQATDDMEILVVCDRSDAERQREIEAEVARVGGERVQFHGTPERVGHPDIFNLCVERAAGEWVHILHDDDRVEPGFYRALERAAASAPGVGAAFCQQLIVTSASDTTPTTRESWIEREEVGVIEDWLDRIARECRVHFSAIAVRRDVYEALGGFCADALSAFDWEMWVRVAARYPVAFVPELLATIRRDDSAETTRLLRSGEQVAHAFAAVEVAAYHLPPDRAAQLSRKARDRTAAHALEVAAQYLRDGDVAAALANLRAGVAGRPSPTTLRRIASVLQGVDRGIHG